MPINRNEEEERPYTMLPYRQKEFIKHFIETGDAQQAMLLAGYSERQCTEDKATHMRRSLSKQIDERTQIMIRGSENAIFAMSHLKRLAASAESEMVRFQASREILSRTSAAKPEDKVVEHRHKHEIANLSDEKLAKEIRKLQRELGGYTIDVTPTNVETEEAGTLPAPKAAGRRKAKA